jgi:hypothetical protein
VYRCRISGFTCAVKIVNIKSLSESALKMMHNEIHFLETLQHESILSSLSFSSYLFNFFFPFPLRYLMVRDIVGFLGHEETPKREIRVFLPPHLLLFFSSLSLYLLIANRYLWSSCLLHSQQLSKNVVRRVRISIKRIW